MGAELIGAGVTVRTDRTCDPATINSLIDAIPAEKLEDEEFLALIDPAGYFDDEPGDIRDILKSGAQEYDDAVSGSRTATYYPIGGTPLAFVWTGGESWGDEPFNNFTALCLFIELAEHDPAIKEAAALVCGGLPSATLLIDFIKPF